MFGMDIPVRASRRDIPDEDKANTRVGGDSGY